jgi:hypothetical protein
MQPSKKVVESRSSLQPVVALNPPQDARHLRYPSHLLFFLSTFFCSRSCSKFLFRFTVHLEIFNLTAEKVHWLVIRIFCGLLFIPHFSLLALLSENY